MKYFQGCASLIELKKRFRELSKQHHPDIGGDAEMFKLILAEYERAIMMFSHDTFRADSFVDYNEILQKIMHWNIDIELIGTWIYCRNSYAYKEDLKKLGFWFSVKHKAWIYNGGKKIRKKTYLTTDDIRTIHGSEIVKIASKPAQINRG
jgi:hypothetical protein